MLQPPPMSRFSSWPAAWYPFCATDDLRAGPLSRDMLGRRLVAYRTESGRLALLDARCSHQGADLGRGCINGENIRCPFHDWQYRPDGVCVEVSGQTEIPSFARQASYPVAARSGSVFPFNGARPLFPLPPLSEDDSRNSMIGKPWRFTVDCPWYLVAGQAFDSQRLKSIDGYALQDSPVVDEPSPFALRVQYTLRSTGESGWLRRLTAATIEVSVTNWGGPLLSVQARFQRVTSQMLIAIRPLEGARSSITVMMGTQPIWPLAHWLRHRLARRFLSREIAHLAGMRYRPETLIESDGLLIDFFRWAAALPAGAMTALPESRVSGQIEAAAAAAR
jgi:nitrite reductase/ring-hydroxylating ferredoxin subunit